MSVAQLGIFEPLPEPEPAIDPLRPYQAQAVDAVCAELGRADQRSTLLVMATGTGKTRCFSEVIRRWPGKALVLAHRDELVRQAARAVGRVTGRSVGIEKADERAFPAHDVVVASVQTLYQESRLTRWGGNHFGLVVADEAHHYVAPSFRRVLDHFSGAKVLGVTATPDRADRLAMGQVFDSVSFVYEIENAITDGYLCPIRCTSVLVEDMQLADVATVAGDLNQGDLDQVMAREKVLHGVAKPAIELAGNRRTLVFTTSVNTAHALAEVFCRYRPDSAQAVDGGMEMEDRRRVLSDHQAGRFQFLINVGIATEGYDDPAISCIVMGRPTKSRSLYTQMAGRGTRICPGKEDLLILDLVGNSGRHKLVSALDILAGRFSDDAVARARKKVEREPGLDAREALEESEAELKREAEEAERRAKARAKVAYRTQDVDPFRVLGLADPVRDWCGQFGGKPASEKQLACLTRWKVPVPENCTAQQATRLIGKIIDRMDRGLCTFGQAKVLQRQGYDVSTMTRDQASRIMDALAANRWRPLPPAERDALLAREPGEDG